MFKLVLVLCALIACAAAKPGYFGTPLAYSGPAAAVVAAPAPAPAPFVTATSSQFIARNHNGVASVPVVALVGAVAAYTGPIHAPLAYSASLPYASVPASVLI